MLLLIRKIETLHLCKAEQHVALTDVNSLHSCIAGNCGTTAAKSQNQISPNASAPHYLLLSSSIKVCSGVVGDFFTCLC